MKNLLSALMLVTIGSYLCYYNAIEKLIEMLKVYF